MLLFLVMVLKEKGKDNRKKDYQTLLDFIW